MTLLVLHLITWPSWSNNSSGCSKVKRTFSNSNVKNNIPYWGKNFQTESIIGTIGDDIRLDNRIGQTHEVTSEIILTWLGSERTP
jgi:hypothetical protein